MPSGWIARGVRQRASQMNGHRGPSVSGGRTELGLQTCSTGIPYAGEVSMRAFPRYLMRVLEKQSVNPDFRRLPSAMLLDIFFTFVYCICIPTVQLRDSA